MTNHSLHVNIDKWIAENESSFVPPVCNKLMLFYQLNIMYVGGPNVRKDYHIEEGEETAPRMLTGDKNRISHELYKRLDNATINEKIHNNQLNINLYTQKVQYYITIYVGALFYQVRGDMVLKVIENGKHKEVHIREGEMFLLPARIPHSPQRQANSVGLVVERRRLRSETDGLRYFVANSTDVLFERWFYCENLGTQLVPIIKEFMESKQNKTGKPDPAEPIKPAPYPLNTMNVMTPFCFREWLEEQKPALASGQPVDMFGAKFETEVRRRRLAKPIRPTSCKSQSDEILVINQMSDYEQCPIKKEGSSNVFMNGKEYILSAGDCLLIFGETEYQWKRSQDCVALYVAQDPDRKRPY
ncbi:3-hydroxyanthranilate 3,4-dioxygenase [Anabarilius grahami]|uniref:3-hydroxyanthranilate 3,4-dioxygenase n=1 Tax=Anabarilius grahami TaxID=495550 RepID=A0A3N0YFM8_ANAGA|nr:3-hydroxyanthranilate 3,4-dioxygenase [Anabarilius grahami]